MKKAALFLLVLAVGCGKEEGSGSSSSSSSAPEWKASTPKEFCESAIAAIQRKDFDSLWEKGMTKAMKEESEKILADMQKNAKENKQQWEAMKKDMGVGDDWLDLAPKQAWIAVMKAEAENDPEETKYVKDEVNGDKATLTVTEKKLKKKKETDPDPQPKEKTWPLLKEDGLWKMNR